MWFSFRTRLTRWENQHYVERNFTKMAWLRAHRAPTRHSLEVQIVPQRMWVHIFLEARSLGCFLASVPYHLGGDRRITGMPAVAWKPPYAWLARSSAPGQSQG